MSTDIPVGTRAERKRLSARSEPHARLRQLDRRIGRDKCWREEAERHATRREEDGVRSDLALVLLHLRLHLHSSSTLSTAHLGFHIASQWRRSISFSKGFGSGRVLDKRRQSAIVLDRLDRQARHQTTSLRLTQARPGQASCATTRYR